LPAQCGSFSVPPAVVGHPDVRRGRPSRPLSAAEKRDSHVSKIRREWKMKIKPMNDRVLVQRVEEEQKTAGGIIIPDTAKEKPQEGKVMAVGPGKLGDDGKRVAVDVKVGDRILFSKYAGTEIEIDGVEHMFMREDDILGVLS
jgi:chaperonin GroES